MSLDGEEQCRDRSPGSIASWLLHATTRELAAASTGGLLLHAAAVTWDGKCVLLPGPTGAGKTTLAAYLSREGFQYLTDELTFVPDDSTVVEGFVRPLKIKHSGIEALKPEPLSQTLEARRLVGAGDVLEAVGYAEDAPVADRAPLGSIIFPNYKPAGPAHLRKMSAAQTGLRLMECALNARVLPDHGFGEVARLANTVPSYELRYSDLGEVETKLCALRRSVTSLGAIDPGGDQGRSHDTG